ncbi:PREDICTED: putative transcription factor bHLH041 [Nelumbo nucifera]|uniref:Transcription factor bHLH041 n=1 Tax=Nelumbo nucifera TaxID=4432 RepID=A0A1U8Q0E3_NELNU|nr:PREDICTED: putative transcription factor bHLH041 [Nelumbo nucifera]
MMRATSPAPPLEVLPEGSLKITGYHSATSIIGLAFKEGIPYMELNELELQSRASTETQRRFYREARIKAAAFMGCKSGEIEIGTMNPTQINMEMEIRKFFPEDLNQQLQFRELLHHQQDQNRSSSSLSSMSVSSPEYSSLVFSIPSTCSMPKTLKEAPVKKAILPTPTETMPVLQQQTTQPFQRLSSIRFPSWESDDAAMTRAMLAVISSPSTSSSSHHHQLQSHGYKLSQHKSAFKDYISSLAPIVNVSITANIRRNNMQKRAIAFFKSLYLKRNEEEMQATRQTSNLNHIISERKRRAKLNERFRALSSLLPPGSKKNKLSVLSSTREYLIALKAQVLQLQQQNRLPEGRLVSAAREASEEDNASPNERIDIRVVHAAESTSEERQVEVRVTVIQDCDLLELGIRLLEFIKQTRVASLVSMEANTQMQQMGSFKRLTLKLNIKGSEWDEATFRESIARIVANLPT